MGGDARRDCCGREARRLSAMKPLLPPMLGLLLLLSVARAQQATQLRRSSATEAPATLCGTGSSCDDGSKEPIALARVVSELRESEARTAQLRFDLTTALVAVAHSSKLAAVAARNACYVLEQQASADAVDRPQASASFEFRRAADEQAALRRRVNGADERLRAHDVDLRAIEWTLIETRSELSATTSNFATVKSEMASNLSTLADALMFATQYSNETINASKNKISELSAINDQQDMAIGLLNRTQQQSDIGWKHQALALSAELNSTKRDLERLRDELGYLRDAHERLIVEARNISALLRGCPSGWQRNGSWCYFLVDHGYTWSDSRGRCKMLNADFVTIMSPDVNAFLSAYMKSSTTNSVWLGGTDEEEEGVWKWVTGEIFYVFLSSPRAIYNNFMHIYHNNYYDNRRDPANCLAMHRGGGWGDMRCNQTMPFFCQMYRP